MITTRTRLILVQHVLEVPKVSNTGRTAAEALANLERHVHGAPPAPGAPPGAGAAWLDRLEGEGTWLLFPGGQPGVPAPAPERLVVLDASWSQARRMVLRLPRLRALPRWSLAVPTPEPSLRQAPPGGVSTLQAIARAVELLEGAAVAEPLHALHRSLVARQLAARGYL